MSEITDRGAHEGRRRWGVRFNPPMLPKTFAYFVSGLASQGTVPLTVDMRLTDAGAWEVLSAEFADFPPA